MFAGPYGFKRRTIANLADWSCKLYICVRCLCSSSPARRKLYRIRQKRKDETGWVREEMKFFSLALCSFPYPKQQLSKPCRLKCCGPNHISIHMQSIIYDKRISATRFKTESPPCSSSTDPIRESVAAATRPCSTSAAQRWTSKRDRAGSMWLRLFCSSQVREEKDRSIWAIAQLSKDGESILIGSNTKQTKSAPLVSDASMAKASKIIRFGLHDDQKHAG